LLDDDEELPTLDELAADLHPPRRTRVPTPESLSVYQESEAESEEQEVEGEEERSENGVDTHINCSIDDEGNPTGLMFDSNL